jgi:hypothetical protein
MDDLAAMLKTMEPADVASMFAGARGSVPIYSGLYSKDASGPDELAFEARNRATSTAQRDAAASAAMQQRALEQIPEDALRKAVAARMREEAQYPPALATRRADFVPQPRHEMRAFDKGGVVRSAIAGVAKGAKTAAKAPAAAKQISRDLMPSSLSIEKLAESLGVNVKEAPNVLSRRESTKNLREFLKPSAVQHRVFHGSNNPEGIVEDSQFAHYDPDQSDTHWLATDPDFADQYTAKYMESPGEQGAIFPAHIQLKNPIDIPFDMNKRITPEVWKFAEDLGFSKSDFKEWLLENDIEKPKQAWRIIDSPQFREAAMARGYDGIRAPEAGSETFGVFDRNRIKSQFNEGTYDTKTPDIGKKEGGSVEMRAFNKGGGVRKTLQEMADSLLLRGVKTADKPDLARRSLFGLKAQPALDLPLARIDDIEKSLSKDMGRDLAKAPAITEKTVTVDPGKGAAKSTLQSLVETPMSRRAVLSAAAGQVLRHALPGVGDAVPTPDILGEIAKIVDVAKPAQAAAAALPVTLESVLAGAIGQGIKQKEAVQLARLQFPDYEPGLVKDIYKTLKDPYKNVDLDGDDADLADLLDTSRPAENMKLFTGAPSDSPLYAMRPYMRALKQASPTVYDTAKAYSKDTAMDSVEGMAQSGLLRNEDEIARFLRNDPSIFDLISRRQ